MPHPSPASNRQTSVPYAHPLLLFRYPRRPVLAASMSLHSPPPPSERSQLEAEEHGLEEEEKEECDHLSAALVTAHIASLRMLHVPFRFVREWEEHNTVFAFMQQLKQQLTPPLPHPRRVQ